MLEKTIGLLDTLDLKAKQRGGNVVSGDCCVVIFTFKGVGKKKIVSPRMHLSKIQRKL